MIGRRAVASLAVVLLGATGQARAQEDAIAKEGSSLVRTVTGRLPEATAKIRLETDFGSVAVEPSESPVASWRARVRTREREDEAARRALARLRLFASRSADGWIVSGRLAPAEKPGDLAVEIVLAVPKEGRAIDVYTGAGEARARGLAASVSLTTRAGNITADDMGGDLQARTRGGGIAVGSVRGKARLATAGGAVSVRDAGAELIAQTSGGDVTVGRVAGHLRVETGGGSVRVDDAGADAEIQTAGGGIMLGRAAGQVNAASAGGGIRIGGAANGVRCETAAGPIALLGVAGPVRAITSSGGIRADFLPATGTFFDSDIQTWQGDIVISLPETLPLTIHAVIDNAPGRGIRSDFPLRIVREAEDAGRPIEVGDGSIAGGGAVLNVRTVGGTIAILKQRPDDHHGEDNR